ncbi:LOW QUALITY PROTEIN: olfactory receptor 9G1-like [Dama dama]
MERSNYTVTDFILVGFTTDPRMQLVLFVVLLGVCYMTVLANTALIGLTCNDSRLHTPMYFFTGNLSFLDLWYPSVYTPKILLTCISEDKRISFAGCVAHFFFSGGLAYSECYLLATMAYDCYMAIYLPLIYSQAMPIKLCAFLVAASHLGGFINCSVITKRTFTMNFCNDNVIDEFFCDLLPLVELACGKKDGYQALYFLLASNVIAPAVFIFASYLFIIANILRICSTQGRLKAFSTCSSHLISVTLYYGPILYIYSHPCSNYSFDGDKIVSTFYTMVFPMLNPMIYSLRNRGVRETMNKLFK